MLVISDLSDYVCSSPTSVALGRFDGVHLGHKAVINAAVDFESDEPLIPAVFTFEQSPHGIITGEMVYALLTDSQKHSAIENEGIRLYFCPHFSTVKEMLPEEFVLMLKKHLNVRHISCGFNFTFGKNGMGNPAMLKDICKRNDIALTVVPPVEVEGEPVSSSLIRKYIENGEIDAASRLLGYRFYEDFPVINGDKRGREMKLPTINQKLPPTFIHPKYGVYATRTLINGKWHLSVSNVGVHPTVGSDYPRVETNILDFDGDLYGEGIKVEFFDFLRDELSFNSVDELIFAINADIKRVRELDIPLE